MTARTEACPCALLDFDVHEPRTGDESWIRLRRVLPVAAGRPVLLVHGASAGADTFLVRVPHDEPAERPATCCAEDLAAAGRDVWLLDWRGSKDIVDSLEERPPLGGLTYDAAARWDLPLAVETLQRVRGDDGPVDVVAHCMGGAVVAQAIAVGQLTAAHVRRVVFSALALFYRATLDRSLLVQNELAERLFRGNGTEARPYGISPRVAKFPSEFEDLFDNVWSKLPTAPRCTLEFCQRLSFLFGTPYETSRLVPGIHTAEGLSALFGTLSTQLLLHGAQNMERGYAGPYQRLGLEGEKPAPRFGATTNDYLAAPERFRNIQVTLLTGARNRVWHRDGMDLMYEWLQRGAPGGDYRRVVLQSGGHQDLFWGAPYRTEVRELLLERLNA